MTRTLSIALLATALAACAPSDPAYDAFLAGAIPSGSEVQLARDCLFSGVMMFLISSDAPSAAERLSLGFEGFRPGEIAHYNALGKAVSSASGEASWLDAQPKSSGEEWLLTNAVAEGWQFTDKAVVPTRRGAWQRLERRVNWCAKHFNVQGDSAGSDNAVAESAAPSDESGATPSVGTGAEQTGSADAPQAADDAAALDTDGLKFAADLQAIYAGRFDQVHFKHDGFAADAIVEAYVDAFNDSCQAYMPANKVEITEDQCTREQWEVDDFGDEVPGSRSCTSHQTVRTGRYEDPELRNLADSLEVSSSLDQADDLFSHPFLHIYAMGTAGLSIVGAADSDMPRLLSLNGCGSAATKRFQENLVRFGRGENP